MKKLQLLLVTLIIYCSYCTPAQVQTVNTVVSDVVNAAEFGCIMSTTLTNSSDVALACGIVKTIDQATPGLLSFIDSLIQQRLALLANGYMFDKTAMKWSKK